MKPGKISFFFFLFVVNFFLPLNTADKIISIPLVNLENLEPSFEKEDVKNKNILNEEKLTLKEKKNNKHKKQNNKGQYNSSR